MVEGTVTWHYPKNATTAAVLFIQQFTGVEDIPVSADSKLAAMSSEYLGADDVDTNFNNSRLILQQR